MEHREENDLVSLQVVVVFAAPTYEGNPYSGGTDRAYGPLYALNTLRAGWAGRSNGAQFAFRTLRACRTRRSNWALRPRITAGRAWRAWITP